MNRQRAVRLSKNERYFVDSFSHLNSFLPMSNSSEQEAVVSSLNRLLSNAVNAREGYRTAAQNASDSELQTFLNKKAQERSTIVANLEDLLRASGGDPDEVDTAAGKAHRGWINVRSTIGDENASVINECLRGEEHAINDYESALKEESLSRDARDTLSGQLETVQAVVRELEERR
ncbi:MAG: hypothetical protein BRD40_00255 [Bacteroidetes bacterium QS_1_65_9]|nr:MAG: hypothetical protein BRD40_00255 [Bacteroidetes bacterium QS_1_65_9]